MLRKILVARFLAPRPSPLLQDGKTPLAYANRQISAAAAALLRADPRVAAAGEA